MTKWERPMQGIPELRQLNERLAGLLKQENEGAMWLLAVAKTVKKMADVVGYGPASTEVKR